MIPRSSDLVIFMWMTTELMTLLLVYSVYGGNNNIICVQAMGLKLQSHPRQAYLRHASPVQIFL